MAHEGNKQGQSLGGGDKTSTKTHVVTWGNSLSCSALYEGDIYSTRDLLESKVHLLSCFWELGVKW